MQETTQFSTFFILWLLLNSGDIYGRYWGTVVASKDCGATFVVQITGLELWSDRVCRNMSNGTWKTGGLLSLCSETVL